MSGMHDGVNKVFILENYAGMDIEGCRTYLDGAVLLLRRENRNHACTADYVQALYDFKKDIDAIIDEWQPTK